jgi:hypothetical protein
MTVKVLSAANRVCLSNGEAHGTGLTKSLGTGTHSRGAESTGLRSKAWSGQESKRGSKAAGRISRSRNRVHDSGGHGFDAFKTVAHQLVRGVKNTARRRSAKIATLGAGLDGGDEALNVGQLGIKLQDDSLPVHSLLGNGLGDAARRTGGRRRGVLENNLSPALEHVVCNVQSPVDSEQEGDFVLVDLVGVEPGNLAPGACRVVAVLKILGSQDEGGEEHATAALQSAVGMTILGLLHDEVVLGHMGLNEDQVVQSHLEGGVASARASKSLLDKSTQRQNCLATKFTAACHRGERPDRFDDLRR